MYWKTIFAVSLALSAAISPAGAAPTPSDAALLRKAVAALEHTPALTLSSKQVTTSVQQPVGKPKLVGSLPSLVHFERESGGRFRSVIQIKHGGRWTTLYETVGDGTRVWTYAALLHQYTVAPEAQYRDPVNLGTHLVKLGLFGALLAGGSGPGRDVLSDVAALAERQGVSSGTAVHGRRLRVITLDMGATGLIRLSLDPKDAQIVQLTLSGQGAQAHYRVMETVQQQALRPSLPASVFRFAPPTGSQPLPAGVHDFLP